MRTKPSPLSPNASPGMTATCSAASSFSQNSPLAMPVSRMLGKT